MGTAQKQGSKPDSSGTRPESITLSFAYLLFNSVEKKVQESMTQFLLKGQATSTGRRAHRPAVRSFLDDSCILEKDLDSTSCLVRNALTTSLFPNKTSKAGQVFSFNEKAVVYWT